MSYIAENLTQKMEAQTQWGNKYACIHTHTSYLFTQTSNLFFCLCMHHVSSLSSRHWKSVDVRQKTVVSASAILKYHEWQTKPQATKPFWTQILHINDRQKRYVELETPGWNMMFPMTWWILCGISLERCYDLSNISPWDEIRKTHFPNFHAKRARSTALGSSESCPNKLSPKVLFFFEKIASEKNRSPAEKYPPKNSGQKLGKIKNYK